MVLTLSGLSQNNAAVSDSIVREQSFTLLEEDTTDVAQKPVIDAPINYNSFDSMAVSMEDGQQIVHLYGKADIKYGTIELQADYIAVNFEKKEIFASGLPDSTGELTGKPHFAEGSEEFDCESLRYNFVTGKGFVVNVVTEQQDGLVRGGKAKMMNKDVYCMVDGKYSTCTAEHPHFYLKMVKGKVIRNKAIITGRSYLVLEDFPIYFPFLPYGYIPTNNSSYSSGVIIPSYGEESRYGFYLRDGGFYWAASDYFDFKITGDVYSKGKWGLNMNTNYKLRYKFGGGLALSYSRSVTGERGVNQTVTPNYSIRWNHSQDGKANPTQTFSASVDFSSSGHSRENEYTDADRYMTNSKTSSISYRKNFQNLPISLSANIRANQNTRDSTVSLTLPSLNVNMNSIYPFRRKNRVGKKRFYEDFKLSYSTQFESSIKVKEDQLLTTPYSDWRKGVKHNIPITLPSFQLFNHINVVPSFNYSESWNFSYTTKHWVDGYFVTDPQTGIQHWVEGHVEENQKSSFKRNYNYNYGVSASTTLYGMYTMRNPNRRLKAIRHKIDPRIGFSYHPDFAQEKFGFYEMVQIDSLGSYQRYDIFEDAMYRAAGAGESGSINFGLNNNIEMKLANVNDTTTNEKFKKVAIFDNLGFSGSYNLAADSMKLSTIGLQARTKIAGNSITITGTLDPYALDKNGRRYDEYMWNLPTATGLSKLGRLTSVSTGFSFNYSSDKLKKKLQEKKGETEKKEKEGEPPVPLTYTPFDMPWRVSANYSFGYTNNAGKAVFRQSVSINGGFDLTPKWKTTFNSGFDLVAMKMTRTMFSIVRDLHCWTMSFDFVPIGQGKYYAFTLRANASMLKDLKVNKSDRDF